ncbi:hypothetical protein A2V71_02550 [Candidatus Berkelbacteria bacterium RBG_13_40_8]|uniref:Uncharacterized protein n=1 Tax=Candidatus Berkelbacteria bacterium RBG_13_40_8 TaxID=1797467 RepID=A0A1F5DN23_9BACT|nr:MAG: hypothetical protein A2V71_02550 [Candidatus Berkelbacteria bacterium RBG_13_40_8]
MSNNHKQTTQDRISFAGVPFKESKIQNTDTHKTEATARGNTAEQASDRVQEKHREYHLNND